MTMETSWRRFSRGIRRLLPKDRFVRSAMILAGGTTLAQGLAVLLSPILTRLYTPNDFGLLAIYSSILAMAMNIASFRYEFAIPIPEDNQTAIDLLALCMALVFFTSVLGTLGFVFFYDELSNIRQIGSLKQYIWFLPVGFLFAGAFQVLNFWAVRERLYHTIARTSLSQGIAGILTQMGLGFLKTGPFGLLLGQVIGQSAGIGTLAKQFWKKNKDNIHSLSITNIRSAASRYKDFPLYQSSASLLNSAGLQVPSLLFAVYYGVDVAGWFYLTQKVLAMPISLIGSSVSKVFLGEAARLSSEPLRLQKLFREINVKLFMLGIGPCLILAVAGQWIFKFVFGAQWVQSGVFVQVMAFVFLLKLTTDSVINFAVIERQDFSFFWALMRLVVVFLGIMSAVWLDLPGFWAVVLFSAAMIFSYMVKYVMWSYAVKQLIVRKTATG